jgi:hypothetical protein
MLLLQNLAQPGDLNLYRGLQVDFAPGEHFHFNIEELRTFRAQRGVEGTAMDRYDAILSEVEC